MKYRKSAGRSWKQVVQSPYFTLVVACVGILSAFSLGSKHFMTVSNMLNIGMYAAVVGVCGCAYTFVLASGLIDLSAGSIMGLSAMCAACVATKTGSAALTILTALCVGLAAGWINGFLITKVSIMPFIATVGTAKLFRGLVYVVGNGNAVQMNIDAVKWLGRGYLGPIPVAFIILVVCAVVFSIVAKYTVFGRRVYLIGGNASASFLSGINVDASKLWIMTLNGLMCGLAGLLIIAQLGACLQESGNGYEFNAISGGILGGVSLAGGKGTVLGTMVGIFLLSSLQNGLTQMAIPSYWQNVVTGAVLIVSVTIDVLRSRMAARNMIERQSAGKK